MFEKLLLATTMFVSLPFVSDVVEAADFNAYLLCVPVKEMPKEKKDPVLQTLIKVNDNGDNIHALIIHTTQSGTYNRADQYAATIARVTFGRTYVWSGTYAKDRTLTMTGKLYLDDGQWTYEEVLYNKGVPWYTATEHCF